MEYKQELIEKLAKLEIFSDLDINSAEHVRLLKRVCPEAHLTGLELEAPFVERARQEAMAAAAASV